MDICIFYAFILFKRKAGEIEKTLHKFRGRMEGGAWESTHKWQIEKV